MPLVVNERESVAARALAFVFKCREIARHAQEIMDRIDADDVELVRLSALQGSLYQQKADIQNWPWGSLRDLAVRQRLAQEFPSTWATAADVNTETIAGAPLFDALTSAIEATLAASDAVRQRTSNDPVTGARVLNKVPAADCVALRAAAAAVRAHMPGTLPG